MNARCKFMVSDALFLHPEFHRLIPQLFSLSVTVYCGCPLVDGPLWTVRIGRRAGHHRQPSSGWWPALPVSSRRVYAWGTISPPTDRDPRRATHYLDRRHSHGSTKQARTRRRQCRKCGSNPPIMGDLNTTWRRRKSLIDAFGTISFRQRTTRKRIWTRERQRRSTRRAIRHSWIWIQCIQRIRDHDGNFTEFAWIRGIRLDNMNKVSILGRINRHLSATERLSCTYRTWRWHRLQTWTTRQAATTIFVAADGSSRKRHNLLPRQLTPAGTADATRRGCGSLFLFPLRTDRGECSWHIMKQYYCDYVWQWNSWQWKMLEIN